MKFLSIYNKSYCIYIYELKLVKVCPIGLFHYTILALTLTIRIFFPLPKQQKQPFINELTFPRYKR